MSAEQALRTVARAYNLKLDADDLNALFGQFGFADYMKHGSGALEGQLIWPGMPQEFAVANLAGTFKVEATVLDGYCVDIYQLQVESLEAIR